MIEKRRILLLFICFAALCMTTAPTKADLFDFMYGLCTGTLLDSSFTYDTGDFSVSVNAGYVTMGGVTRLEAPMGDAWFFVNDWIAGADLSISMAITNIGDTSADGSGSFIFTDIDGDTITGNLAGTWGRTATSNDFEGTLSNVIFTDNDDPDGNFDATYTAASMSFSQPSPWIESLNILSETDVWFNDGIDYTTSNSNAEGSVVAVPVPAAVILGILGLGAVGIKLRKYA